MMRRFVIVDFVSNYYYNIGDKYSDEDKSRAKQKAVGTVLPLIMENELTKKQSVCLRYKYINGKTQKEIANLMKLSQPTVSRHINAAKEILNNSLKYCYIALEKGIDEYEKEQQHI